MKLIDIINKIDTSKKDSWVSLQNIAKQVGIYDYCDGQDSKLQSYFYRKWYCTDTYVGGRVYFLDDLPICVSFQTGRKSDEIFRWISKDAFNWTRTYLLTLVEEDILEYDLIEDLDEDDGIDPDII